MIYIKNFNKRLVSADSGTCLYFIFKQVVVEPSNLVHVTLRPCLSSGLTSITKWSIRVSSQLVTTDQFDIAYHSALGFLIYSVKMVTLGGHVYQRGCICTTGPTTFHPSWWLYQPLTYIPWWLYLSRVYVMVIAMLWL